MPLSSAKSAGQRRGRILDAALRLLLRHGPRGTTMESIAREAGIAKPTLYAYFGDKEAVIAEVAATLAKTIASGFDAALTRGEDDPVARIGNALAARHKLVAQLLGGSPHAGALCGESVLGVPFRRLDEHVEAAIQDTMRAAGIARARQMTQLLLAAAAGIAPRATTPGEIGPAIRLLTERLLRPELA